MKKLIIGFLSLIYLQLQAQSGNELDSVVKAFDKANLFHGVVSVSKDGKVLLSKGYGLADASANTLNDPSLAYQIGSVNKQFTAIAIMKLQEEGKLNVMDTLSRFFPEIPNAGKITIHHLLTHSSGLYNYTNDTTFWLKEANIHSSKAKMISRFSGKPLEFEPGSKYSYSNSGYLLLGYIIEKVSGKTYENYMRENIFYPLGMKQTGFDFTQKIAKATGYYDNGTSFIKSMIVDSSGSYAAGAMYSTVNDLQKWVSAIHDKKLISPESWTKALTPFKENYAYGFSRGSLNGKELIWHNGGIHGFLSQLVYFPGSNSSVILLSNYMQSNLDDLARALSMLLHGEKPALPKVRTEIQLPLEVLQQYTGTYELFPGFSITVSLEGNNLVAKATGQETFRLFAEKEDFFFYKAVDAQVRFVKGADGKISHLILYQNGQEVKGQKIK